MRIHWHRRDLRAVDNRGLAAATDGGQRVLPVFVFDDAVLRHAAPARVAFLLDALDALRDAYRERGGDLVVTHGDPSGVLPDLAAAADAAGVTWCRDYTGLARDRDETVREALVAEDVPVDAVHDAVCHPPETITTSAGECYSVFTYYGRKWHDREKADPVAAPEDGVVAAGEETDSEPLTDREPLPDLADLGFEAPSAAVPDGSRAAGLARLEAFCEGPIYRYGERRDYPGEDCTSRLSPHLTFGTLGIREVFAATEEAMAEASGDAEEDVNADVETDAETARESVREFQTQLAWREFYAQVLWANPETVTANFQDFAEPIDWRDDPEALSAWQDGETGYPIVDAGMRQLREESWMHNRVRMIVASFLTKDLLLDWREGYAWFRERLVDHDTANDVGGWQWAASTGTDAQPYFRVFNPMTQGQRFDPEAEYIRAHVPELGSVPADVIHGWDELDQDQRELHAPEYPAPIVDHAERREEAIAMFERARGE